MNAYNRALEIIESLELSSARNAEWSKLGEFSAAFELMADDGANVIFKVDGERRKAGLPNSYTVVVSGGRLGENFLRKDTSSVLEAVCEAILFYNQEVWKR